MNPQLTIILSLLFAMLIGAISVINQLIQLTRKIELVTNFRNKFIQLVNLYARDGFSRPLVNRQAELYTQLMMKVVQVQQEIGDLGLVDYKFAGTRSYYSNYQVLLNTIPKFKQGEIDNFDINLAEDCLLKYLGVADLKIEAFVKDLKNPIVWLREGIKQILFIPVIIMNWVGLIPTKTKNKLTMSSWIKVFTGLLSIISLLGTVMTILLGYNDFITIIKSWYKTFF